MNEIELRNAWQEMALSHRYAAFHTIDEVFEFYPDILPDNRARGFVNDEGQWLDVAQRGGTDMFGVEWVYIPSAGGSMEKPGCPHLLEEAKQWQERILFPDVTTWDWEGSARRNKTLLQSGKVNYIPLLNGFGFERLISFMGFENAAMALIDEDQFDDLAALLDRLADIACQIIDLCCRHYDIDGFLVHDDWGSQRDSFFSPAVGRDLFVPAMRKITDRIHANGKVAELHSCGCIPNQIENIIAAGWDIWHPMVEINDTHRLFEQYGNQIVIGVAPETGSGGLTGPEALVAFAALRKNAPDTAWVLSRYADQSKALVYKKALT